MTPTSHKSRSSWTASGSWAWATPDTLTARANLAISYRDAGRTYDAIDLQEQVLASQEQFLDSDHPDTLATRRVLQDWRTEPSAFLPAAGETGLGHVPASGGDA